jgi:1,6-anhydro-N-acetylmuramate kinase
MHRFCKAGLKAVVLFGATGILMTCATTPVQTDVKAEVDKVCQRQQFGFGEPLDKASARDNAVAQKFAAACRELLRQDGLDFGNGTTAYTCRVFLPRVTDLPPPEKLKEYEARFKDKNEFNELVEYYK